eukprot:1152793-Pelagomonas_calceolata.AAC.6
MAAAASMCRGLHACMPMSAHACAASVWMHAPMSVHACATTAREASSTPYAALTQCCESCSPCNGTERRQSCGALAQEWQTAWAYSHNTQQSTQSSTNHAVLWHITIESSLPCRLCLSLLCVITVNQSQ